MGDESGPIRQAIGAHAVGDTGSQDLLGAAAADAQQEFDRGAVDEGAGKSFELPDHLVDFAVPAGFCRQGVPPHVSAHLRKMQD